MTNHKSTSEFNPKKEHKKKALKFIEKQKNIKTILIKIDSKTWIEKKI